GEPLRRRGDHRRGGRAAAAPGVPRRGRPRGGGGARMSTRQATAEPDLLGRVLTDPPAAFALVHRPESGDPGAVEVLTGEVTTPPRLRDVPLPGATATGRARHDVLVVVPYRQVGERGFRCVDDGAPLLAMTVTEQTTVPLA